MRALNAIALLLLIIGGINWGLWGAANYNLVDTIFGAGTAMTRTIYVVVGIAALWSIPMLLRAGSLPQAPTTRKVAEAEREKVEAGRR